LRIRVAVQTIRLGRERRRESFLPFTRPGLAETTPDPFLLRRKALNFGLKNLETLAWVGG
jgi:hypothetical protein